MASKSAARSSGAATAGLLSSWPTTARGPRPRCRRRLPAHWWWRAAVRPPPRARVLLECHSRPWSPAADPARFRVEILLSTGVGLDPFEQNVIAEFDAAAAEANGARAAKTPFRHCLFVGPPGTGKSECLRWTRRFFEEVLGWTHGVQFQMVAPQHTMALLIGGGTVHWFGQVPINATGMQQRGSKKGEQDVDELFERTQSLRWLLIDEIEALAAVVFGILHGNLCKAMSRSPYAKRKDGSQRPFGGVNLSLSGDCWHVLSRQISQNWQGRQGYQSKGRCWNFGCHRKNRGGVYPSGKRCKSLCKEVLTVGFLKEEVNHAAVAVGEMPLEHIRGLGDDYVSGSAYNAEASMRDEHLVDLFNVPYNDVRHMFLSHNHTMLTLRVFLASAHWDLKVEETTGLVFCDDKGRLSIAAVAEHVSGKELAEVLKEGIECETLDWKMDIEEPGAASIISQVLNTGHELVWRTTELTAVAVLKGEIIVQMSKDVGQKVAFATVRDRVRIQLDSTADDPDLPELFDFLISAGVGN